MSDTPNKIHLNLDNLDRREKHEPFAVVLGGREIVMKDPAELDWKQLLEIENPASFFKFCLSDEDREYFRVQHIEGWKLRELIEAFQRHYNLESGKAGV